MGERKLEALAARGRSSKALFQRIYDLATDVAGSPGPTKPESRSTLKTLFAALTVAPSRAPPTTGGSERSIADEFGVLVREHNPEVALDNLFLIPGGADGCQPCRGLFDAADVSSRRMANVLRRELEALPGAWRVFVDTDGDLDMSATMRIVVRAVQSVAMFTEADASDFRRVRVFLQDLLEAQSDSGASPCAAVGVICFNKVAPDPSHRAPARWEPLGCGVKPHLLAVRDLVARYTAKLANFVVAPEPQPRAARLRLFANVPPALRTPGAGAGGDEEALRAAFIQATFMVVQEFKKPVSSAASLSCRSKQITDSQPTDHSPPTTDE